MISQRLLGNEEIILIHDTDCGVETFTDEEVKEQIYGDTALRLSSALEAFEKAEDDVKQTARRIKASPFVPPKQVRGFVCEVKTGSLREVSLDRPVLRRVLASIETSGALVEDPTSTAMSSFSFTLLHPLTRATTCGTPVAPSLVLLTRGDR